MSKQDGEADRARHAAAPRAKRRKSSRAKRGATSQPKLQGRHRRGAKTVESSFASEIAGAGGPGVAATVPGFVLPAASPSTAGDSPLLHATVDVVPGEIRDKDLPADTNVDAEIHRSDGPAESLDSIKQPSRVNRVRPSFVRWATAASIAAACLLALGRRSDTHGSARAVPDSVAPIHSAAVVEAPLGAGLPAVEIAARGEEPASAQLLAPPEAVRALNAQDLAMTIAPAASQRVVARDATPVRRIARLGPPAAKPVATEFAAASPSPPGPVASADLAGHDHAPGRYQVPWGTARLQEDPNADRANGPVWDFVASTGE